MELAIQSIAADVKCNRNQVYTLGANTDQMLLNLNTLQLQTLELPPSSVTESSNQNNAQRFIKIKGTTIHFMNADLTEVPGITFSADLEELFTAWNSAASLFNFLKLKGVGVPLRYWRDLYAGSKERKKEIGQE